MIIDKKFLNETARDLPIIRPIKEFIHLNLLLPYQHLPFWEALGEVSTRLEACPFSDLAYYRERIKCGELPLALLREKLNALSKDDAEEAIKFIQDGEFDFIHHDTRSGKLHDSWNQLLGINIIELADGVLIKWLSMFLDQGIGHWQMPRSDKMGFYECVRTLLKSSYIKPEPFNRGTLEGLFPASPEEAIRIHLPYLCPEGKLQELYCKEAIMTLRGWAGLIYNIQEAPELLPFKRKINLLDFLAVKLVLERAWIQLEGAGDISPDFVGAEESEQTSNLGKIEFMALRACQETLEEVTYGKYINDILIKEETPEEGARFQAVFCMDDRESSLRQHLEEASGEIETFGIAGHFGIECLYQHPEDAFPKKQCPAPVPAKVLLKDLANGKVDGSKKTKLLPIEYIQPTGSFFHDWFFSHFNAVSSTLKLSRNLFFPLALRKLENVREIEPDTRLKLLREESDATDGMKLSEGYSMEEMAEVVHQQLMLIGFVHHYSPLVFIIGHGSNSENNPYFATYGCGACSGRAGSANARAFAIMANNPEVRELILRKFGLKIPSSTRFVAGLHDTCRDIVELYNTNQIPETLTSEFKKFKKYLSLALYKNARERSKVFKLVTFRPVSKEAQKEVIRRSYSLFETRPEMGHTNVAFAVVGTRKTTKGLVPDRPAFFQSYDPSVDSDGKLLAATLGAVIPVCSGINLDYFFSRVDNLRFGAGSKLPQNIVGNFGVSHGTESDLLFGLPFQMIDQHQPLRLLVLVEQYPEVALAAIQENPLVRQIVYNNWVHYVCYDKRTKTIHVFEEGKMVEKSMRRGQA